LGQAALSDDIQDLACKLRLGKAFLGIRQVKIRKYVAASVIDFKLFFPLC